MEMVRETLQTLELPREKVCLKSARPVAKWLRPPDGFVKINSDGAFNVTDNLAATGAIAREGLVFRGATSKIYRGVSDPLFIESLALRDAVIFARGRCFSRVVFEVDSEDLVRLWHNRAKDRSVIKQVLDEISELSQFLLKVLALVMLVARLTRQPILVLNMQVYMMGCFPGMLHF
jgi:hypothetical protein